jgi:Zn-dependent M16 (insulinase) family peptidase
MRLAPGEAVWRVPQGMGAAGMGLSLADEPALPLVAHALEWLWLRERIRREGGAYGVRCRAGAEGSLVFLSARDPDPRRSLVIFAESAAWLARELRGGLLERARRGMLERLARPLVGEEALARAFAEGVAGAAARAEVWREVAEIDAAGVGRIAERLAAAMEGAPRIEARVSS